jgi:16S rRNA processing protein RimM
MKVESMTERAERFAPGSRLFIEGQPVIVEGSRSHRGRVLLKLQGIDNPEGVEPLRGKELEIPLAEVPPPPPDALYYFQIIGCQVITTDGRTLGQVAEILPTAANDIYIVRGEQRREILIPALKSVVLEIDPASKRMVIEPLPGLLEPPGPPAQ